MNAVLALSLSLLSTLLFPYWFSVLAALTASVFAPTAPLVVGIFVDAAYYAEGAYAFPVYSVLGAAATITALSVRHFVKTRIM